MKESKFKGIKVIDPMHIVLEEYRVIAGKDSCFDAEIPVRTFVEEIRVVFQSLKYQDVKDSLYGG